MEDLDKQLAQLQLMNSRDLSPKPMGIVKKVGPAVPPKPMKKTQLQPSLQRNDYSNMKLTLDNPAILEQKLEALEHHKRVLENQQKRRLQTGSGGQIDYGYKSSSSSSVSSTSSGAAATSIQPPPSSSSSAAAAAAIDADKNSKIYENQNMLYENMKNVHGGPLKNTSPIYSYLNDRKGPLDPATSSAGSELIYSNILHNKNGTIRNNGGGSGSAGESLYPMSSGGGGGYGQEDLPPPPPLDIPPPLNLVDGDYHNHLHQTSEDDLPPPPSPVSSSYSELRRATDNNFSSMPTSSIYPSQQTYQHLNNSIAVGGGGGGGVGAGSIGGNGGPLGSGDLRSHHTDLLAGQTYANAYHPDYQTYVPSSQSFNSDYCSFGSSSQSSSTYESIYEPINPRPPSQMSSRSNYSLYTPYVSGPQAKLPCQKEAEVDALTDLLVRSMDNSTDIDSYGICVQCGERVVGENSGCTAMEQIYHIACFTCCQCQINLQGKPFYALDGKPCCEDDYLNTLEKCSVCMKPILERILRATGKPYHPGCFCCVVCGKSLDGVPFTVDATNQNHCIEDFHKKFAPRCCVCRQPIMPEPGEEETVRVVALDRSFHVSCYKCEDCGLLLSSEAEGRGCFPLDDHILCKSCNAKRVQALTSHMTTEL